MEPENRYLQLREEEGVKGQQDSKHQDSRIQVWRTAALSPESTPPCGCHLCQNELPMQTNMGVVH